MKRFLLSLSLAVLAVAVTAPAADAKRLGGGGSSGMQRSLPSRSVPAQSPAKPMQNQQAAAPAVPATPAAAAAAPKRNWMGPLAGLAAGLGLAALFSHFGMGEAFSNFMMMALLAVVAVVALRWVMSRFAARPAQAGGAGGLAYAGASASPSPYNAPMQRTEGNFGSSSGPAATAPALAPVGSGPALPAGFDTAGFERAAKMIFIRLQAANDAADLEDLRRFTTPEMFAAARLDLQDRPAGSKQQTDVVQLNAEVLDVAEEGTQQVVSVRFHGLIREDLGGAAHPFDEVWHLVKPADGSREWAIAGIQQAH